MGRKELHRQAVDGFSRWSLRSQATTTMIQEIMDDVRSGTVPQDVATFSRLHDYVDANEYGGFCDDEVSDALEHYFRRQNDEGIPAEMIDFFNECQSDINEWLQNGGIANALKARRVG